MSPLASQLLLWSIVGASMLLGGLMRISGRCSDAEREVSEADLAAAVARNAFPRETIVRTVCRCGRQIGQPTREPYDRQAGAVRIVRGECVACRIDHRQPVEIDLGDYADAAALRRHLLIGGYVEPAAEVAPVEAAPTI